MVRGCFDDRLRQSKQVKMMLDHSYDFHSLVGMADMEDSVDGLIVSMSFDKEHELHRKIYKRLKDGSLDSLSIGFMWPPETDYEVRDGIRYIKKADLIEVSFVFMPANKRAKITEVKSIDTIKEAEAFLREVGLSRSEAKALISAIKKAAPQRDDEGDDEIDKKALEQMLEAKLTNLTENIRCLQVLNKY